MNEKPSDINEARPTSIRHLVGQKHVIEQVVVALDSAQQDGRKFDHALLVGPPGAGKTATAQVFDIGITTSRALSNFLKHQDATRSGDPSESASGNGSIMRLAPVPIHFRHLLPDDIATLSRMAEESSLTTHASPQCLSACRYMALVLAGLIHGEDRDTVLSPTWEPLTKLKSIKTLHPLIEKVADGSFKTKKPPAIRGSGWVVESLEAALWAFHDATSFEEAVLRAVNLGDDADTTGAVCGQFAGAWWGESGIPVSLRNGLARMDMIDEALEGIIR